MVQYLSYAFLIIPIRLQGYLDGGAFQKLITHRKYKYQYITKVSWKIVLIYCNKFYNNYTAIKMFKQRNVSIISVAKML